MGIQTVSQALSNENAGSSPFGFKNRIINGAIMIDQRNAGANVSIQTTTGYTIDRWATITSQNSKYSVQQNAGAVTPPAGFTNYLGVTSSSTYSVLSSDLFHVSQIIEGYNIADLSWGTASASYVTLSFKVYSSLTGTFGGSLQNSANTRSYPFTYTISLANVWTTISVTIPGDTSGTWLTTNGVGIRVYFGLGIGSTYSGTAGAWAGADYRGATGATSVVSTSGATFYITGVQFEKSQQATSFDYRPFGTELALCQRYYQKIQAQSATQNAFGTGFADTTTTAAMFIPFQVQMRTSPAALDTSGTAANYSIRSSGGATTACSLVPAIGNAGLDSISITLTVASGLTAGQGVLGRSASTSAYLGWSAEL
jgi:hypothetical protein